MYDFSHSKLRLGGEYMLKDKLFLVGEGLDLLHGSKRDVYVGVRAYF